MAATISHGETLFVTGESSVFASDVFRIDRNVPYVAGNTVNATGRKQGISDWYGHYLCYARDVDDNRQPARFPNDSATVVVTFDGDASAVTGTGRISKLTIEWPFEQGGYITHRVDFKCNGALTTTDAVADETIPCPMNVKNALLKVGDDTVANVNYMRLEFEAKVCAYCNSSTSGWMGCDTGFLDITAMWRVDDDDPANWPTISSNVIVYMYVTAAKYWALTWMRIEGVLPMHQDTNEPDRVTGYQVVAKMNASDGTNAGSVVNPKGTTVWNS